ncbi:MAG TPA: DUF3592 domain-containing protein [Pyrinomonadaceae bacterium]|nr:DUF3592 domain-containing protein [Pyrinomonadaceae bacterium]
MKLINKFIIAAAMIFASINFGCSSNLTAQSTAQITRAAIDRDTKTSRRKTSSNKKKKKTTTSIETEIDYRYTVGGKTYEGYSEKDGDVQRDFPAGAQVVVCYNPADPEESDVFASGYKCG